MLFFCKTSIRPYFYFLPPFDFLIIKSVYLKKSCGLCPTFAVMQQIFPPQSYLVPSAPGRRAGRRRRRGPSPLLGPGHALGHQHVVQAHQLGVGGVAQVVLGDTK